MTAAPSAPGGWQWRPIAEAPLGVWGVAWHPLWRRPFPAMRNGSGDSAWVDTCEPEARGYQAYATHWCPQTLPTDPGTRALDAPTRSAAEAALDEAVKALRVIKAGSSGWQKDAADRALAKIEALVPGAGR